MSPAIAPIVAKVLSAGAGRLAPAAIPTLPAEGGNDMSLTIGNSAATALSAGTLCLATVALAARPRRIAFAASAGTLRHAIGLPAAGHRRTTSAAAPALPTKGHTP